MHGVMHESPLPFALGHLVEADWVRNQLLSRVAELGIDCVSERVESVSQRGVLTLPKNELDADFDLCRRTPSTRHLPLVLKLSMVVIDRWQSLGH